MVTNLGIHLTARIGNIQRLYEIFRRELGVSPGEYRKQRQLRGD